MILTSNRTREVHDALKRRCLYHWIDYPTAQKEYEIVLAKVPEAPERLAREVVGFVHRLREADLTKVPGHRRDARLGRGAPVARCPRARAGARRRDARRRPQVRGGHPPGPRRGDAALPVRGRRRRLTRRHDGSLGIAAFDNDDASDWVYDLEKRGLAAIDAALADAEGATDLESRRTSRDRRRRGRRRGPRPPGRGLREDIQQLAIFVGPDVTPDHAVRAQAAAERVLAGSEVAELWDESGEGPEWRRSIDDLVRRLSS